MTSWSDVRELRAGGTLHPCGEIAPIKGIQQAYEVTPILNRDGNVTFGNFIDCLRYRMSVFEAKNNSAT